MITSYFLLIAVVITIEIFVNNLIQVVVYFTINTVFSAIIYSIVLL